MNAQNTPDVLTIDRNGEYSLRTFWLTSEKEVSESVEYMQKAMSKAYGKPSYEPLLTAFCAVRNRWDVLVSRICERGGLLHIGAGV